MTNVTSASIMDINGHFVRIVATTMCLPDTPNPCFEARKTLHQQEQFISLFLYKKYRAVLFWEKYEKHKVEPKETSATMFKLSLAKLKTKLTKTLRNKQVKY